MTGKGSAFVDRATSAGYLPRAKRTQRILRAMDQRCFSILAHPSGRLLGERGPYDVDMARIIDHARQRGCLLDANS